MKSSAIVEATSDDAVKEVLLAGGWTFDARGQSHCATCAKTPTPPAARTRKRTR